MSPSAHAHLSPSAAERWLQCPASIRMTDEYTVPGEDRDSVFAREGTIAHALGEIEAGLRFGLITRKQYNRKLREWNKTFEEQDYETGTLAEMQRHIQDYVDFIAERMKRYPDSIVMLEQRMDTGVPDSWGTSDVVILSPAHIEIIDLKYGQGIPVSAEDNPQLKLYACGALDTYGDMLGDTEEITMTVFQPRLESKSSESMDPDDLRAWRDGVAIPGAKLALSDNAPFGPGPNVCRFCPVAGICTVRVAAAIEEDFGTPFVDEPLEPPVPEAMTPYMLGQALHRIPEIKQWCESVEKAALDAAYTQGKEIPGWKVVMSGGKRQITDQEAAIKYLTEEEDFDRDEVVNTKIKGIGELEKLIGKKVFPSVMGQFITKTPGREALVPEEDDRPAISPATEAAKEFDDD